MQPYRFNEPTLFDRNNRPTVDEVTGGATPKTRTTTSYEYDSNGNVTTKTLPGNQAPANAFDELNRWIGILVTAARSRATAKPTRTITA